MPPPDTRVLPLPSTEAQLRNLLLVQLANWRWSWRAMVVLGIAAPTLSIAVLSRLVENQSDALAASLLIGNVVLALMLENQNKVASHFAYMRITGALTYYAALPIRQGLLIVATALAFFLLSIPAVVVTSIVGSALLDVTLHPSPLVLIVAPLIAVSLAGIGAVIGTRARTLEEASSLTLLLNLVLLAGGPVIVPESRLPDLVAAAGHVNPATYAASALKQSLVGPVTADLIVDICVLASVASITLIVAAHQLKQQMS
jgi:ABC-2 type transport system permease protein